MEMKGSKKAGSRKRTGVEMQTADTRAPPSAAPAPPPSEQEEKDALTTAAAGVEAEADAEPKVIMSRAQRRKLKKPPVVVTAAMKEKAREEKRELRKYLRMIKSNGSRRKVAKLAAKREREEASNEEDLNAFDPDYRMTKRGRRLE